MIIPALMWWEGGGENGLQIIGSTDCPVCHRKIGGNVRFVGLPSDIEKTRAREMILSGVSEHMKLHEKEGVRLNVIEQPKVLPDQDPAPWRR